MGEDDIVKGEICYLDPEDGTYKRLGTVKEIPMLEMSREHTDDVHYIDYEGDGMSGTLEVSGISGIKKRVFHLAKFGYGRTKKKNINRIWTEIYRLLVTRTSQKY